MDPEETLEARMKYMRNALSMTQSDLANVLQLGKSSISNIENGRAKLTYDQLFTLVTELNVNPIYLLTGDPPILLHTREQEYTLNEPFTDYITGRGISMIPISAQSDYVSYPNQTFPTVVIPGIENREDRVFEVAGDSMYPVICSQDYVVCSPIQVQDLRDGELCVVVSRQRGVIVTYARTLASGIRCYPANRDGYEPQTVSYEDLYELWRVNARITRHVGGNHLSLSSIPDRQK